MLDGDVNRSHVFVVCVRVGMAVRLSGKDPKSEMVLDRDVIMNESCVYSVCTSFRVGVAVRLSGEVGPTAMVLAEEVCSA